jgi:hypothetical protein
MAVMADVARGLVLIWAGAWRTGGGDAIAAGALKSIDKGRLRSLCCDEGFVRSMDLDHIGAVLK